MIKVKVFLDDNEVLRKIIVTGHSGFAKRSKDIVCAAVSSLILTSYIALKKLVGENVSLIDKEDFIYEIKDIDPNLLGEINGITLFLITGLVEVQKKYNKYIDLKIEGVKHGTS